MLHNILKSPLISGESRIATVSAVHAANENISFLPSFIRPVSVSIAFAKNPKPYNKRSGYKKSETKPAADSTVADDAEETASSTVTYKADFKPQQHKAEYKNFEEYLAAHSKD